MNTLATTLTSQDLTARLPQELKPDQRLELARDVLNSPQGRAMGPLQLNRLLGYLNTPEVLAQLTAMTNEYMGRFAYRPMESQDPNQTTYRAPLGYQIKPESMETIYNVVVELAARRDVGSQVIERVIMNPAVLAKMGAVLEHLPFMTAAKTKPEQEARIRDLVLQYAQDDVVLRFAKAALSDVKTLDKPINVHELLMEKPELYARAAIAHRWACRQFSVDPIDIQAQITKGNGTNQISAAILGVLGLAKERLALKMMVADLRLEEAIPCDSNIYVGESLFFQRSSDPSTLSLASFQLDCFERNIRNLEVSADLLPFDPAKRLPGEYTAGELARARALARLLNQTFTVHSPIVGPLSLGDTRTPIFEDAADNVALMKETVDLAERLGARTVVVHISDRFSQEALENYAEIALHAVGKVAEDGSPIRVSFENYMSKLRPDKTKPFPTMTEHFAAYRKIVLRILERTCAESGDPTKAMQHVALLLDSAHFNLVSNFREDPVKAVMDLIPLAEGLAEEIATHPTYGPLLEKTGFDRELFRRMMVSQLHLNQNIGPIAFTLPGVDFNPDLHNPVEGRGTIDNSAFQTLLVDAGFGVAKAGLETNIIVLAEQKKPLSPGGLRWIYDAAKDQPGFDFPPNLTPIEFFVNQGEKSLLRFKKEHSADYAKMERLLEKRPGVIERHYAYMAGRFGIPHLREHLETRAAHSILSSHVDPATIKETEGLPQAAISLHRYEPGDIVIKKGTTYEQAKIDGTANLYLIVSGSADVELEGETIPMQKGMPLGEIMFLTGAERSANVRAGKDGLIMLELNEDAFWDLYKEFPAFHDRIKGLMERRLMKSNPSR